ncbi:hypothetical protein ANTQUA_LOCUS8383 [Anthophora quadrimaculata]
MSKTPKAKTGKRNAGTQTREIDTVLEIARLQEQVKLLTIENEHLRKYTSENSSAILQFITPTTSPNYIDETDRHNESKQKALQNQSTLRRSNKPTVRGCTCKGKCSSKICGCVKKHTQCGELCKCDNNTCKNQEHKDIDHDKENLAHNELTHGQMKSQQLIVNANKSLFSPDVTIQDTTFNIQEYQSTPLYIDPPKKLTFVSDEEQTDMYKNEKLKKTTKNDQKIVKNGRDKRKKNNLQVNSSESVRNVRSSSNENKHRQNNMEIEKQKLSTRSSSEMQINKEIKEIEKRTKNYVQNIMNGMVSLRRRKKETKEDKSKDTNNDNNVDLEEEVTSSISPVKSPKEIQEKITNKVSKISEEETNIQEIQTHNDKQSCDINKDNDIDFNPMKPKHELPRTPVHGSNKVTPCNTHDNSPFISVVTTAEEAPVSINLSEAQVNWEEYQSQLVACNKCKRKFHPLRIKKHELCCRNV